MYTIEYFIWGYQHLFQMSLQHTAKTLFKQIDAHLEPNVFLIGVLVDERSDRHPVCIEPEDCGYSINAFTEVKTIGEELEKIDEEGKIFHSHPIAQENHEKKLSNKGLMDAIRKILKKEDLYGNTEKYISDPTYVEGFLVFVVLELQKNVLNKYYSLTKEKAFDRYSICRSFIEGVIDTYLQECAFALKDPNRSFHTINRPSDEILREAASQFMYTVSNAGGNIDGLHGLYNACNTISSLKYEGAEGIGKMIIAKRDHPNIRLTLELEEQIDIRDYRKVRKFLQLTNENTCIICDSALIYGLGEQIGNYNPNEESLFTINFVSHYKWQILHDNNLMMTVEYMLPNLPKEKLERDKFYSDLRRIFNDIKKNQLDDLWDLTIQGTKQKHGTMLVISDKAKNEASRLGKQCFTLAPLKLLSSMIHQVTSIDGAVLLDRDSICYAIGVILDGLATDKGDSSRGARYNSAIRYYENLGDLKETVIVVISEDGMIDLIPNLKPTIKHSKITVSITKLIEISKSEKINRRSFSQLMNYFENNAFYLTEEECKTINTLRQEIEANDKDGGDIRFVRKDFAPDPEMNNSYYAE